MYEKESKFYSLKCEVHQTGSFDIVQPARRMTQAQFKVGFKVTVVETTFARKGKVPCNTKPYQPRRNGLPWHMMAGIMHVYILCAL